MSTRVLAKLRKGSDTTSSAARMASIASPFPAGQDGVRALRLRGARAPRPQPRGRPALPSLTEVVQAQAQRQPAGVGVLQLRLRFLHDGLEDGGGDVPVAGAHGYHPAGQGGHASHLEERRRGCALGEGAEHPWVPPEIRNLGDPAASQPPTSHEWLRRGKQARDLAQHSARKEHTEPKRAVGSPGTPRSCQGPGRAAGPHAPTPGFAPYLHAGLGVSHHGQQQGEDVLAVGARIGQPQAAESPEER